MKKHSTLAIVTIAFCSAASPNALAAVCKTGLLDGPRQQILIDLCNGNCGIYAVGADSTSDLGFGGPQPDIVRFEFYSFTQSPPATGTFELDSAVNANYATCEQCIVVYQDFSGGGVAKTLFQTGGSITIDMNTVPGLYSELGLSWSNVSLAEVTIDPETFVSTLVPGGECVTIIADTIFADGFGH